jgi:hypothetical protein
VEPPLPWFCLCGPRPELDLLRASELPAIDTMATIVRPHDFDRFRSLTQPAARAKTPWF